MVKIITLKHIVNTKVSAHPYFIGFLPSEEIKKIAEAPAFTKQTPHQRLAEIVLTPPIRDWQRPISLERVQNIAHTFSNSDDFMPNPVLLSENVLEEHEIVIKQQMAPGGHPTSIWEIELPDNCSDGHKPLWILDGQHRISGLAASTQKDNGIPVVLLMNNGGNFYSGASLAKIFAQVTTTAEKLDELHNEWLTFAFELDNYSRLTATSAEHNHSMQCVAELCKAPTISGTPNAFFNRIKFNHFLSSSNPSPGGFSFTCKELKELIYTYYYKCSSASTHLAPVDLCKEMVRAHRALVGVVLSPNESVFFGSSEFEQKIMQVAFWSGVFSCLLTQGPPYDWDKVLKNLSFDSTNWNFKSWVASLHGKVGTSSKRLAIKVFTEIFSKGSLPSGVANIADYLKGDKAYVDVTFSKLTSAGRVSNVDKKIIKIERGSTKSTAVVGHINLRITTESANIASAEVSDKQSPPGKLVTYDDIRRARGLTLCASNHANPIMLLVTYNFYGGTSASSELDVSW